MSVLQLYLKKLKCFLCSTLNVNHMLIFPERLEVLCPLTPCLVKLFLVVKINAMRMTNTFVKLSYITLW